MKNKSELLAPAGSFQTFKSVIQAGADAVYLAGDSFGARAYAGNLSSLELLEAIEYAHIHNKQIYLTVNTLLKNNEIFNELYHYIDPFYRAGLDAVIVQDLGVMEFLNQQFPGMDLHASTQMTVTDEYYASKLQSKFLNLTRIVPARELSLDEIKKIHNTTNLEIETFVHGALCYSYSGQCLMSSFIGGRSGNRGRCAQPCRLNYKYEDKNACLLSLKDLSTLEILPEILKAGVYSLKIEGRMKSAEYAAGITSIYRKYLDIYQETQGNHYKISKEDAQHLLMLFDRGGVTKGYYIQHNSKEMIADSEKSNKSLIDKKNYQEKIKQKYVDYQTKKKINGNVIILKNKPAILTISDSNSETSITVSEGEVLTAINKPMLEKDIVKQLSKLGNTPYEWQNLEITIDENIFIPNKVLNDLRRNGLEQFTESLLKKFQRDSTNPMEYEFKVEKSTQKQISVRALTFDQAFGATTCSIQRLILECEFITVEQMVQLRKICTSQKIELYFAMPRISRLSKQKVLEQFLNQVVPIGMDGCLIRNLGQITILEEYQFKGKYMADYNIYSMNNLAGKVLFDCGVSELTLPVELNKNELKHLEVGKNELIIYGKIPNMITSNCIDKTVKSCHYPISSTAYLEDRTHAKMFVVTACNYCYNIIYNSVPNYLIDKIQQLNEINCDFFGLNFTDETQEDTVEIIESLIKIQKNNNSEVVIPKHFTRGHYNRGVE